MALGSMVLDADSKGRGGGGRVGGEIVTENFVEHEIHDVG
jgi:hypothetical protein